MWIAVSSYINSVYLFELLDCDDLCVLFVAAAQDHSIRALAHDTQHFVLVHARRKLVTREEGDIGLRNFSVEGAKDGTMTDDEMAV